MATGPKAPFLITSAINYTLNVTDFYSSTDDGYVIATAPFAGNTLSLSATFAADLYVALNRPKLTQLTNYKIFFSPGNGYMYTLASLDANIVTTNSMTFAYNGGVIWGQNQPLVFNLTSITPPTFAVYG